jgi:hypothetical protein
VRATGISHGASRMNAAIFSQDRTRRYRLERAWIPSGGFRKVGFVMLNPSVANEAQDDPTIRKCKGFAKRWGYSGIVVTNLIPVISTDPYGLPYWDGLYRDNDPYILEAFKECVLTVVAWGSVPRSVARSIALYEHIVHFRDLARDSHLCCIGTTKNGNPLHPSRAAYTDRTMVWEWE